ncbi:MAG: cbb3-type cytochrome c oxidase subunit I [Pseudomonadales bacterium]|nr:cbb3-type cytochrome c oxidase subunit I [Pseudomonadales bacterium]
MNRAHSQLDDLTRQRTIGWIWLGVFSLLAAGVLSLLLAFSRTPFLQDFFPGQDFFHVALVVHVDLSVLVWFMACAGMVWTVFSHRQTILGRMALWLAVTAMAMITAAPFIGADRPLMNNYVPVLQHGWFLTGLAILAFGLVLQAVSYLLQMRLFRAAPSGTGPGEGNPSFTDMIRFALALAAGSALLAVACIGWSWSQLPDSLSGEAFYEYLFWGGGHVQQFTNTLLALVAWVILARAGGSRLWLGPRSGRVLFALTALPLLTVPWIYRLPVDSGESIRAFTELMRTGGLAAAPLCLVILTGIFNRQPIHPSRQPLRAVLLCSLTLFAAGGLLGFMIKGSNTMIPAHYHGSIVGVTLAFMGVVYHLLPNLGHPIRHIRMLAWQPYLLAGGQLMHITGLAISGGYGVQRKVAGAEQALDGFQQTFGMGLMGAGGLLAAIGRLLFMVRAYFSVGSAPLRQVPGGAPEIGQPDDGWYPARLTTGSPLV